MLSAELLAERICAAHAANAIFGAEAETFHGAHVFTVGEEENREGGNGDMGDGLICAIFLPNANKPRGSGCPSFPLIPPTNLVCLRWSAPESILGI